MWHWLLLMIIAHSSLEKVPSGDHYEWILMPIITYAYMNYLNTEERSTKVIKKAEFGDGLHLYCKSHGLVQWYFQKFKSNREAITLSSSPHIYIYPVQQYSAGTYYCYGQNSRFQTFLASFELLVYGKFLIQNQ